MIGLPLLPDVEPDILFTNAWFNPETFQPAIYWQLNQKNGLLSLTETRARAQALFQAVGYAEGEAAIVKGLLHLHRDADRQRKPQGFLTRRDITRQEQVEQEALVMAAQVREFLKQGRAPLLEGLEVIFGLKTRKALINCFWYDKPIQWDTLQALDHAILLIETAEAAESDAFFRWFLMERIGIEPEETYSLIAEFQTFRQRRQLEDLFKGD